LGIGGRHNLCLAETVDTLVELKDEIPLLYEVVESSQVGGALSKGFLTKISSKSAEGRLEKPVPPLSNLKMHLVGEDGSQRPGTFYGKVLGPASGRGNGVLIRFTSVQPEIEASLRSMMV
jgi:hypothetical protein